MRNIKFNPDNFRTVTSLGNFLSFFHNDLNWINKFHIWKNGNFKKNRLFKL